MLHVTNSKYVNSDRHCATPVTLDRLRHLRPTLNTALISLFFATFSPTKGKPCQ